MVTQLRSHEDWRAVLDADEATERSRTDGGNADTLAEIERLRTANETEISDVKSDYVALYGEVPVTRIRRRR